MEIDFGEWKLRPWAMGDVPSLAKYANNRNISRNLRDTFPYPYTEADAAAFIERVYERRPVVNFAIVSIDEAVGGIGVHLQEDVHRRSMEIGYWLGEPFWNKGIMTGAVRAITDYAFATFDLARVYATVFEGNEASCRVLEKVGFALEGRLRKSVTKEDRTIDSLIYAKVRD